MNTIDLHIHTIASGHGINTFNEIIDSAVKKGMEAIAITDHGPRAIDGPGEPYFYVLCQRVPEKINSIRVFKGIEANILDTKGNTDIPSGLIPYFDLVLAYMHPITNYRNKGIKKNTKALLNAFDKYPAIDILAHPVTSWYPVNIKQVVKEACTREIALELNESTFKYRKLDKRDVDTFIEQTIINNGRFVLSSDAHLATEIGTDEKIREIIDEYHIPEKHILNKNLTDVLSFINRRKKIKQGKQ